MILQVILMKMHLLPSRHHSDVASALKDPRAACGKVLMMGQKMKQFDVHVNPKTSFTLKSIPLCADFTLAIAVSSNEGHPGGNHLTYPSSILRSLFARTPH